MTGNPAVTGEADCDRNRINSDGDTMIVHDTMIRGAQESCVENDNESSSGEIENSFRILTLRISTNYF